MDASFGWEVELVTLLMSSLRGGDCPVVMVIWLCGVVYLPRRVSIVRFLSEPVEQERRVDRTVETRSYTKVELTLVYRPARAKTAFRVYFPPHLV